MTQEWKNVNNSRNGRLSYEMIEETRREVGVIKDNSLYLSLFVKSMQFDFPRATRNLFFKKVSPDFMSSSKFLKKSCNGIM